MLLNVLNEFGKVVYNLQLNDGTIKFTDANGTVLTHQSNISATESSGLFLTPYLKVKYSKNEMYLYDIQNGQLLNETPFVIKRIENEQDDKKVERYYQKFIVAKDFYVYTHDEKDYITIQKGEELTNCKVLYREFTPFKYVYHTTGGDLVVGRNGHQCYWCGIMIQGISI